MKSQEIRSKFLSFFSFLAFRLKFKDKKRFKIYQCQMKMKVLHGTRDMVDQAPVFFPAASASMTDLDGGGRLSRGMVMALLCGFNFSPSTQK